MDPRARPTCTEAIAVLLSCMDGSVVNGDHTDRVFGASRAEGVGTGDSLSCPNSLLPSGCGTLAPPQQGITISTAALNSRDSKTRAPSLFLCEDR